MFGSRERVGIYEVKIGRTGWTVYAKTKELLEEVEEMGWGGKIGKRHLHTEEETEKIEKAINDGVECKDFQKRKQN